MASHAGLHEVITRLKKPLRFAAGLDMQRLRVLKGLEKDINTILERSPGSETSLAGFKQVLEGLDSLPPKERKQRIQKLLAMLEELEGWSSEKERSHKRQQRSSITRALKELDTEVQYVKGVGPRLAERLERLGIYTVNDLILHIPTRYEDRREVKKIRDVHAGERATIVARIMDCGIARWGGRTRGYQMILYDDTGFINARWFHYSGDYLEKKFPRGQTVIATEVIRQAGRSLVMNHPELDVFDPEGDDVCDQTGVVPVYPLTEGLFQKTVRRIVRNALSTYKDSIPEFMPDKNLESRGFPCLADALHTVHIPPEDADLDEFNSHRSTAHQRLAYDEFFFLELGLALRRRGVTEEPAKPIPPAGDLTQRFRESLPFTLTNAQEQVIGEIRQDLERPHPMLRLLQGDVGSGKTVVAVLAALSAIEVGCQVAIMAPTEILAEQHYRTIRNMLAGLDIECVLLTGSVRGRERERMLSRIASGEVPLVMGTHAVIQEKVKFKSLALGIIDEQHRFGVIQRARLKAKGPEGATPHLLVMTATPIPRTLAMTVYGDLAVSVIKEMPPGRQPVVTRVYKDKQVKDVLFKVRKELEQGRQAYVVYPLVEESENMDLKNASDMAAYLQAKAFPDFRVGLIHGRLRSEEKEAVMRSFLEGDIHVLVATPVIEVGIDVPNATVMMIEHAERFGLSQLHQLRGRVGRGEYASSCYLVSAFTRSEDAWRRLKVMEKTNDGFKIAEEDLALRGPGEFFGTRQSGLPDFRVANIIRDMDVLQASRQDAFDLALRDPDLAEPGHELIATVLRRRWGKRLRLGSVG